MCFGAAASVWNFNRAADADAVQMVLREWLLVPFGHYVDDFNGTEDEPVADSAHYAGHRRRDVKPQRCIKIHYEAFSTVVLQKSVFCRAPVRHTGALCSSCLQHSSLCRGCDVPLQCNTLPADNTPDNPKPSTAKCPAVRQCAALSSCLAVSSDDNAASNNKALVGDSWRLLAMEGLEQHD